MSNPNQVHGHVQCTATNQSNGIRCKRKCAPGFTVCSMHGAGSPQAKAAAERALAIARMPAIEALLNIVEQFNDAKCATCGYPSGDTEAQRPVINAAKIILDRTGMGPHSTLEVKQGDGTTVDLKHWTADEVAELRLHLEAIKQLKERVKLRMNPGVGPAVPVPVPVPDQTM